MHIAVTARHGLPSAPISSADYPPPGHSANLLVEPHGPTVLMEIFTSAGTVTVARGDSGRRRPSTDCSTGATPCCTVLGWWAPTIVVSSRCRTSTHTPAN